MAHNETEIGTLIKDGKLQEASARLLTILAVCNGNTVHAALAANVHHATLKRWIITLDDGYKVRAALEKIRQKAKAGQAKASAKAEKASPKPAKAKEKRVRKPKREA